MIGLLGAHRTGKTTLARDFARSEGIPFVQTDVSGTFKRLNYSPKEDYDFATRLFIQEEILTDLEDVYANYDDQWVIADRTPLDLAAYTLADIQRQNVPQEMIHEVLTYVERCFDVTNRNFSLVVMVQPGIEIEETEGKAPANMAYIEHLNFIMKGLVNDHRILSYRTVLGRSVLDLNHRVDLLKQASDKVVEEAGDHGIKYLVH